MVLEEPPAPAARVLLGRALAIFSFWSAAARRRIAVRGPPGMAGDEGRPTLAPLAAAPLSGEEGRGEDYIAQASALELLINNRLMESPPRVEDPKVAAHRQQLATLAMVASRHTCDRLVGWPSRRDGFPYHCEE